MLRAFDDGQEMVACQLTRFAGKTGAAIGEEDFSFADATRIKQHIAARRVAGWIFIADAKLKISEGNPAGFPAPTGMNQLLAIREETHERRACLRRIGDFQASGKVEWPCCDM